MITLLMELRMQLRIFSKFMETIKLSSMLDQVNLVLEVHISMD